MHFWNNLRYANSQKIGKSNNNKLVGTSYPKGLRYGYKLIIVYKLYILFPIIYYMEFVVEIKITYFFIRKDITFDLCTFHIIGVLFFFVYVFFGGMGIHYHLPILWILIYL